MAQSEAEILSGLAAIINELTDIPVEEIQADKSLDEDLHVDSLSMIEIVNEAGERFGVTIPDEEIVNLRTVGDAAKYIAGAQS